MTNFCEKCGKISDVAMRCSHCGATIEVDPPLDATTPSWGWGIFRLDEYSAEESRQLAAQLKKEWMDLERLTVLRLIKSQLQSFKEDAREIRVLVRRDFFESLHKRTRAAFSSLRSSFEPIGANTTDELNDLL
jgi:hypothetical protein